MKEPTVKVIQRKNALCFKYLFTFIYCGGGVMHVSGGWGKTDRNRFSPYTIRLLDLEASMFTN